jgi:hypothetical protein
MEKIFILFLTFQILFIGFIGNASAEFYETYPVEQPLVIDNIHITENLTDLGAESFFVCEGVEQRSYEKIDECLAVCKNCIYRDNGCWGCADNDENNESNDKSSVDDGSWFQKLKNWFNKILIAIGNFVKKIVNNPEGQPEDEPRQAIKKQAEASEKILDYHRTTASKNVEKPTNKSVEDSLTDAFEKAENFSDLLRLRALMMIYCNDMADQDYAREKDCNERFMALFKNKGDKFKEKLIVEINPQKGDAETYKKIVELDALLMAGESASGKGVWFSTDNIKNVRQQIKQKAKIWFKAALEDIELEQIIEWHSLAMAYTSAKGEGMGIMEGIFPLDLVRDRAEILIIKKIISLDPCNPEKQELIEIQNLLNCEKSIIDNLTCSYIQEGDIENAYSRLYKIIVKKYPDKKQGLPLPTICEKAEGGVQEQTGEPIDGDNTKQEDIGLSNGQDNDENFLETEECDIEIYQKELVGWDFIIYNCEKSYDQGLFCFNECGWLPPVHLEESEHEIICYETIDGFVDESLTVSCYPRPEPDSGIIQCVNNCLSQQ